MKKIFIFCSCNLLFIIGYSQTTQFSYDASGNRTSRRLEVKELKQAEADSLEKVFKEFKLLNGELLADMRLYPKPGKARAYHRNSKPK